VTPHSYHTCRRMKERTERETPENLAFISSNYKGAHIGCALSAGIWKLSAAADAVPTEHCAIQYCVADAVMQH